MPSAVKVGDKVWLDHTPVDIPYKLTARWFGPFEVLESRGAQVTLDLPETFGKAHHKVNIRQGSSCAPWWSGLAPHPFGHKGWHCAP
jgi:hypothetical protein